MNIHRAYQSRAANCLVNWTGLPAQDGYFLNSGTGCLGCIGTGSKCMFTRMIEMVPKGEEQ